MSWWTAGGSGRASRLVLVSAVALLLCLPVSGSGCAKETESLVGTWKSTEQGETLDFRSDGSVFFTTATGGVETLQWQADDSNLAIGAQGGGTKTLGYSIDGGVLTLSYPGEEPAEYDRVELQGG